MRGESGSWTSVSLLGRLREHPSDEAAWHEFVARYGKKIYGWCRRWKLQDADAADVTQSVLLKLAQHLRSFVYDPAGSFRGWLKTLTHHAWHDLTSHRRAQPAAGDPQVEERLYCLEARDDLVASLEQALDLELFDQAIERVRLRVHPHTWQAFQLTALEGQTGPEAASRLRVPLTTIYKARSNVQKLLQQEIRRLEGAQSHEPVSPAADDRAGAGRPAE
jgi:RNA polymerase sigma-70 factor (ECF subfamily)